MAGDVWDTVDRLKEENDHLKESLVKVSINSYNQALEDAAAFACVDWCRTCVDKHSILKLRK